VGAGSKTRVGRCAALATWAAACGCTLAPEYRQPSLPVADEYPTGRAYEASHGAGELAATEIGWRDFLADPRLQQLVEIALTNNRDLRIALLNVELLRAAFRIQAAELYPQIGAQTLDERMRTPLDFGPQSAALSPRPRSYSVGLTAAWEIDVFGRLRSLEGAALEQFLASIQARKAAQILLVSQVADQYLTLLAADELLEVTQRTLDADVASYDLVKLQFETGAATELDLKQAETAVEQARSNRAAQLRARAQAENGLVQLLGQPLPSPVTGGKRLGDQNILADIPAGLPSQLLTRRPDVLQAEALLRSANANIGAARAAFFPSFSLTGTGGTASGKLGELFTAGSAAWSLTSAIQLPIFNAGALAAELDTALVNRDISIARYQLTIQEAFREVADGLAARGTFDEQISALERFTAAQRRRLELAQLLYKNGQASYLDVLTAQTDLYDAELVLVGARLQRLTNLVDLYRALGGGWIERTGDHPRRGDE